MAQPPSIPSARAPVVSTEVLTDEQCQRILALRTAREVLETKQPSGGFGTGGLDVKEPLLLLVAEWVMHGDLPQLMQMVNDMADNAHRQAALDALADL
jgi:hypothetical protein